MSSSLAVSNSPVFSPSGSLSSCRLLGRLPLVYLMGMEVQKLLSLDKNIIDEVVRSDGNRSEEAVKQGYLNRDSNFLKEDVRSSSCCVTALIRKGNLVVSNVGDCCAVMSRCGVAEALTSDHRPSREEKMDGIETLNGQAISISPRSKMEVWGSTCDECGAYRVRLAKKKKRLRRLHQN